MGDHESPYPLISNTVYNTRRIRLFYVDGERTLPMGMSYVGPCCFRGIFGASQFCRPKTLETQENPMMCVSSR